MCCLLSMLYSDVIIRLAAIIPLIHIATRSYFRTEYLVLVYHVCELKIGGCVL